MRHNIKSNVLTQPVLIKKKETEIKATFDKAKA